MSSRNIKAKALQIKNETQARANSANRVGGLFEDIADELTDIGASISSEVSRAQAKEVELQEAVEEMEGSIAETIGGEIKKTITVAQDGKLVNKKSIIATSTVYAITQAITTKRGETLSVRCVSSANAAVIAEELEEGSSYVALVLGEDALQEGVYTYTADRDMVVVISYVKAKPIEATLTTTGVIGEVSEQIGEVSEQVDEGLGKNEDIYPTSTSGHYVSSAGIYGTNSNYSITEAIELYAGTVLHVKCGCSASVAVLAAVNQSGYTPLVIGESYSEENDYEYTATESISVVISYNNNMPIAVSVNNGGQVGDRLRSLDNSLRAYISNVSSITHTIEVGTGKQYTDLNSAIEAITDSNANNQYLLLLYEGTYNTVDLSKYASDYKGLIIPDYVSIRGVGNRDNIIIRGELPDAGYAEYANVVSTINLTMNGTVENVTIVSKNIRYCNHDDGSTFGMIPARHTFRYVKFVVETNTSGYNVAATCVGIGAQVDKEAIFEACVFVNNNDNKPALFEHDNASSTQKRGGRLIVRNCIFKVGTGSTDLGLANSGGSMPCYAVIEGNAFTAGIYITASGSVQTNKWEAVICGNKNCNIVQKGNLVGVDLSEQIHSFCNSN